MRATAFLGAGAVLGIGGPTNGALTAAVKNRRQWTGNPRQLNATTPAIQQIADMLDQYFAPDTANFEDVFHAIESLNSLNFGMTSRTVKKFKPAIGAFVTINPSARFEPIVLRGALEDIIREVAARVTEYMSGFQPNNKHRWFADFWRNATARCAWDIGTLNYDDCTEQSLSPGTWNDGFVPLEDGMFRFAPKQIMSDAQTRVLHLHGSVLFGYPHPDVYNRFAFEDQGEDLYRFTSHEKAEQMWFGRSQNHAQSGDSAIAGPIITGQRKPDKLLGYPYSAYQTVLHHALINNPRLLIVGYSFGDAHFNRLLSRLTQLHGGGRRVVLIDYVPPNIRGEYWALEASFRDWPGNEMCGAVARLSREEHPLDGRYTHPWVSRDRCCRVYLEGFQDAVKAHGNEILDFLTS